MKTRAVRLYGKGDLRLEEFELPPMGEDEILARIVSDDLCMSSYKAAMQGADHKRVPDDVAENPIIIGHEFCGEILEVGKKWADAYRPGQKFTVQPALDYRGDLSAPGYSYRWLGGDATYVVIPNEIMEKGGLLTFEADAFYIGSMSEPMSCVAGTFHAMYHIPRSSYIHEMGIKPGGSMAILAGTGPMGLAAIDYILHCDRRPGLLVVTGTNAGRLARAASVLSPADAAKNGVELRYVNTKELDDVPAALLAENGGKGYDDVLVFAPVTPIVEQGDAILGEDGCLNFFAGPTDKAFSAKFNFYNVHYGGSHVVGTSGGNLDDMRESLELMAAGLVDPAKIITHIGGLNCAAETTLRLPDIPGGKKLIYTHVDMPLTAIADFGELGKTDPLFARLHEICENNNGLWCAEAERVLLEEKTI